MLPSASPSPSPLTDHVAVVTGASHGIGRAVARGLALAGAQVVATGRTQGALESLDDELRAAGALAPVLVPLDLKDGAGIDRLGAALFERFGRLDILVAAAGALGVITPIGHMDQKVWDQVMAVNLTANFRLIRSMDPLLRRSAAGRALFVSSGVAHRPRAFWGAYAASKAGLETLAAVYADEVEHTPIRVAVINPGPMRTRMRMQAFPGEDPDTLTQPEEIVPLVLELVGPGSAPSPAVIDFKTWKNDRHAPA